MLESLKTKIKALVCDPSHVVVYSHYIGANDEMVHYSNRYDYKTWLSIRDYYRINVDYDRYQEFY